MMQTQARKFRNPRDFIRSLYERTKSIPEQEKTVLQEYERLVDNLIFTYSEKNLKKVFENVPPRDIAHFMSMTFFDESLAEGNIPKRSIFYDTFRVPNHLNYPNQSFVNSFAAYFIKNTASRVQAISPGVVIETITNNLDTSQYGPIESMFADARNKDKISKNTRC